MHDYDQIDALWAEWQAHAAVRPTDPPEAILSDILRINGTALSSQEVSFALGGADHPATLDAVRFTDCMVALLGDPSLRLRHAFAAFKADADRTISKGDLFAAISAFCDDAEQAGLLADEIDTDGDGRIAIEDLARYLEAATDTAANAYRASHLPAHHIGAAPLQPTLARPTPVTPSEGFHRQDDHVGLSAFDLRIGFFRLMQGAAYRSFRENYSANSETHLRARDLPYTIDDFARFTTATIDYYLSLGIITDPGCIAEFRHLDDLVQTELARLYRRISDWQTLTKTPGMLAAQSAISDERDGLARRRDLCRAVIEFILSLRLHGLAVDEADVDILAQHEINRLRHEELRTETHRDVTPKDAPEPYMAYLDSWNRVILSDADARIDGAIMPTRFWYDDFMPQLLRCASVITADDLHRANEVTERDLNAWHANLKAQGAFDTFASDLRDGFPECSHRTKLALQQAWTLTAPYL
ncbi:MAG: hypothetical protein ACKVKF_10280, partial [Rhodobacterales bacterium]